MHTFFTDLLSSTFLDVMGTECGNKLSSYPERIYNLLGDNITVNNEKYESTRGAQMIGL